MHEEMGKIRQAQDQAGQGSIGGFPPESDMGVSDGGVEIGSSVYPSGEGVKNGSIVYLSDGEAEDILKKALETVDGEDAKDAMGQKVTAILAAIRELC